MEAILLPLQATTRFREIRFPDLATLAMSTVVITFQGSHCVIPSSLNEVITKEMKSFPS